MQAGFWVALPVVIAAGTAVTFQASINSALGRATDNGILAAAVSFGVGFLVLSAVVLISGGSEAVPRLGNAAWWMFLGGALGAFYVWASLWGVPLLGVVTMVSALILGQMVAAMVLDTVGAFGLPVRELSLSRVAAAVLVAAGVVLSRF
jgi:transporter family-2 protein